MNPVKVKITDLVDAYTAIGKLGEVPYKLAWRLSRITKKIEPEVQRYQNDMNALLLQYGKKVNEGYVIPPDNREIYQKCVEDRNQETCEVEVMPIPLSLFDFAPDPKYPNEKYKVPPIFFHLADWIVQEDNPIPADQFKPGA